MTVAIRFGVRGGGDAEVGSFVMSAVAALVALAVVAVEPASRTATDARDLGLFALAGLIAPGASQVLFVLAIRDAGPSRASVVVGSAPLFAVAIAIAVLGEPAEAPLVFGAVLIVLAGVALASERARPQHFRLLGIAFAVLCTLLFSIRDNVVRHLAGDARTGSVAAAAAALAAAAVAMLAYLLVVRGRRLLPALRRLHWRAFAAAGLFFGLSYVFLFDAYYRARVSVVSPLVATESLWGVLFSALLFGRSELVGYRLVLAAVLVVSGGVLIGVFR